MNKANERARKLAEKRQHYLEEAIRAEEIVSGVEVVKPEVSDLVLNDRRNAIPPPAPEKDDKNPDGIVDIVTFCEHPYYLGLKLMPWQRIILKTFYAGCEGNTQLVLDDHQNSEGCKGCVWEYVRDSEVNACKQLERWKRDPKVRVKDPLMLAENSPCLTCTRFDDTMRADRHAYLQAKALNDKLREKIELLQYRKNADRFQTEMDLIRSDEIKEEVRQQILEKFGSQFQELVLVLGRRAGKSFMVATIALYEVYRLLMMGHPQERFGIMPLDTITICNVAVSESQAKSAIFDKIAESVLSSPFFARYVGKKTQLELHFLTPYDIQENERRKESGIDDMLTGTIQLMSGHSNSKSLVGRSMLIVIIDEMAAMMGSSSDGGTDSDLYTQLKPAITTFGDQGKIVCISNPLGPSGKFYDLYTASFIDQATLMFQLPTWLSNPNIQKSILESERIRDAVNFAMQYGAEFGSSGMEPFLPSDAVTRAFERGEYQRRQERGQPFFRYFAHLDPAYSSDNYTLVVLHTEPIADEKELDGRPKMKVIVDHIQIWRPSKGHPVNVEEVDDYVLHLATLFNLSQVSYDHWNSQGSINKLKSRGLNVKLTVFNKEYQDNIFQQMFDLFTSDLIDIYSLDSQDKSGRSNMDATDAKKQLLFLQKKWRRNRYKIEALSGTADDVPDCIASAAFQALKDKGHFASLPKSRTTYGIR